MAMEKGQPMTSEQQEKWELKKINAAERVTELNAEFNKNLADRILAAFPEGVDVHCPHGAAKQEEGRKSAHYYTGLNAVVLATEMKEQKFYYPTFIDSRSIDNMQKQELKVSRKKGSRGIKLHSAVQNKAGETILDTRTVYNLYQLQGENAPQEEYLNSPREDFAFEKTVEKVIGRIRDAREANEHLDIVTACYDARKEALELRKERDGARQERIASIKGADLSHKPKSLAECLRQECRKSMEAHKEGYNAFVIEAAKRIMVDYPKTKWQDLAKAIQEVAPVAAYDGGKRTYANFVKNALHKDKSFQQTMKNAKEKQGAVR